MYLTWRRQSLTHDWHGHKRFQRHSLGVSLSESRRVDGKPRRHLVAHLGHIEEARIDRAPDQTAFWYHADRVLRHVEIPDDQRQAFIDQIQERIPRPNLTALTPMDEWMDLLVQDSNAALDVLPELLISDDDRGNREEIANAVRTYQAHRAQMDRWWGRIVNRVDRKHRREFGEKVDLGEIEELKPFDYSSLDPEVAETLKNTASRMREIV